jgi:hypothetical protein
MLNGWMQLGMLLEMCELGFKKHVVLSHCHTARWQGPRYWLVAMDGASSSAWSRTSWRRRSISSSARRFNRLRTRCSNVAITGTWEGQTNQNDHTLQTWPPHHDRWSGNSPELYSLPDHSKKFESHICSIMRATGQNQYTCTKMDPEVRCSHPTTQVTWVSNMLDSD